MGKTHLIKGMKKKIGKLMQDVWSHKIQCMPNFLIVRPTINNEKISTKDQWEYWSGESMLLYWSNTHVLILPMQPGNCQKPTLVQTLLSTRDFYM